MPTLNLEQKTPTDIKVDIKQSVVRIMWADGQQSSYSLNQLRKLCPCAVCNELRKDDDPLRVLSPDQAVTEGVLRPYQSVEMVGNYALQFFWADGHNSGIYTFEFLRQLAPSKA